ncbi:MAG: hypothetical protein RMI56_01495 [Sulfolobales archaeon]|nr:hypothetical protein [Sulfolobales archaeon]MDW8082453.1 hypothetical protein [Sulfolobales archaeon]
MKLRDSVATTLICTALLGLTATLLSHVISERIFAPAVAGVIAGLTLTYLVIRLGGGFTDIAVIGALASLAGTLLSTLIYFLIVGLQWQAMSYWTALEYLTMMIRSGVFIVRFLTDFIIGSAALLSSAGLVAVIVVGE